MLKNVRHEEFAQAYVCCGNASEAWRSAGGKSKNANVMGSRWLAKVDIAERIAEIRAEMEKGFTMSRDEWLQRLQANADASRTARDRTAERQALREIGLAMGGWYSPAKSEVAVSETGYKPRFQDLLDNPSTVEALGRLFANKPENREVLRAILEKASS